MRVFFLGSWGMNWSAGAERFSGDLFVSRYDSFPMNPEKRTLIPYIFDVSNKDPS